MHKFGMIDSLSFPSRPWPTLDAGSVWLAGAGPGDVGLLTLHALNALNQADVIVHDALVHAEILALAQPTAELINVGKRGGQSATQSDINQLLITLATSGKRVLRLKGGDPFVFGRGSEEASALFDQNIPFQIIPGISAGIGGLAYAGIPVTHRDINHSVTFVTGHDLKTPDWAAIAKGAVIIVIYMGLRNMGEIARLMITAGRDMDEPVAIVCAASTHEQTVLETTLSEAANDIKRANPKAPAVICIGPAVELRAKLTWFK